MYINNWLTYLAIFKWQDLFALALIIYTIYKFLKFLSSHNTLHLLGYCYALFSTIVLTDIFNCPAVSLFLIQSCPIIIVILILMHQKSLQKNWLGVGKAKKNNTSYNWLDTIAKDLIWAKTKNINPIIIIEQEEDLTILFDDFVNVETEYNEQLFRCLISNNNIENKDQIILINQNKIKLCNCKFNKKNILAEENKDFLATHITSLTSSIIIFSEKNTHKITIMQDGKKNIIESQQCGRTLRSLLKTNKETDEHTSFYQRNKAATAAQI